MRPNRKTEPTFGQAGLMMIGLAVALSAGMAQPQIGTAAAGDLNCAIRSTPRAHGTELAAVAWSPQRQQGFYSFAVRSTGNGGRSDIRQGGMFLLEPDREVLLSVVVVTEPDARASLLVTPDSGETCEAEL